MVKTIGLSAFTMALFAFAICCLLFPAKVQEIANKAVNWGVPTNAKTIDSYMRSVIGFVQSKQYRICVRLIGVLSLMFSVFALWMLVKRLQGEY